MICQRCGRCCLFFVLIRSPDGKVLIKPDSVLCPYLSWEDTKACCIVHNQSWFQKESCPCHVYGNGSIDPDFADSHGKPCRVGIYIQKKGGLKLVNPQVFENIVKLDDLEKLEANWEE